MASSEKVAQYEYFVGYLTPEGRIKLIIKRMELSGRIAYLPIF